MTRRGAKRIALLALCLFGTILFSALGVWQLERRIWKLDLIERVDARVSGPANTVPPALRWAQLDPEAFEYRKVRLSGVFRHDRETLVDALTERGPGYWVVTPLVTPVGTILINRGFVPAERADARSRSPGQVAGPVAIVGLMRVTEPNGRFLRPNRPREGRWYSRDVAAIARARSLGPVAPFFIDADGTPNPGGLPVGGLTVIHFRNAHLSYALTWFGLAALCALGLVLVARSAQEQP